METEEGYISFGEYHTYYRIANPNGKKIPLLILHGGPGSCHDSYELFDHMAVEDDRPIVTYDQIGCGKSSCPTGVPQFWTKETWVRELINLREKLNLKKIDLMGHSWGGMLSIIYLCDYHPEGINCLVLSSTLSSVALWRQETHRLVKFLPENEQEAIRIAEETRDFSTPESKAADQHYYHLFIGGPFKDGDPDCLTRKKNKGNECYVCSWGESEYSPSGSLSDYEYTDKLHLIQCPTLLNSGVNDESTPLINKTMYEHMTCSRKWVLYPHSRHMTYFDDHQFYVKELVSFLNENEVNQ